MRHVDTSAGGTDIAREILADRQRPLVLISTTPEGDYAFDPEHVARELGGDADVVTIATGEATYALESVLPPKTHAFNGAARSYPPDFGADPDWRRSLLRFPGRATDDLVDDALAQVSVVTADAPARRVWARATVKLVSGPVGNLATLDNGQQVSIVSDQLPPTLKLQDALAAGDVVEGWLTDRDLAPEAEVADASRFLEGSVTLARVVKVTNLRATLTLHPQLSEIVLRKRDVVPGADDAEGNDTNVDDVVRVGQTVRARVTEAGSTLGLSLVDVDGDLPFVEPLPLLRGGAPWLREGVDALVEAPPSPRVVAPAPDTVAPDASSPHAHAAAVLPVRELAEIRDEIVGLKDAFLRLGREVRVGTDLETLEQLRDESAGLTAELQRERGSRKERDEMISRLRQELREARAARPEPQGGGVRTDPSVWPDEEAWLRHEITCTWAERTGAYDKTQYPLKNYTVGPAFISSLNELGDRYTDKVLRAVVDVLAGRAAEVPSRELHRLRQGDGGSDPYVTRADGASCWRVSVESNTASARRLHYWQLPGGRIELSRVGVHDDVAP